MSSTLILYTRRVVNTEHERETSLPLFQIKIFSISLFHYFTIKQIYILTNHCLYYFTRLLKRGNIVNGISFLYFFKCTVFCI